MTNHFCIITFCRHVAQSHPHMVSHLISHLNPVLSSLYYPQRIMATAVFGEVMTFYLCIIITVVLVIVIRPE